MALLVTLAALALPAPAQASDHAAVDRGGCHTWSCLERVARKQCERGIVRGCVRRGARRYRVDEGLMMRIAYCESTMNPSATNGQYVGLYQFGANAWSRTPYARRSRFSAKWSSLAASYAFSRGRAGEWECRG